jgi:hypothetical protein
MGVVLAAYMDDSLFSASTAPQLRVDVQKALSLFQSLGIVINVQKSVLEPVRRLQHLGFLLDAEKGLVAVPPSKARDYRISLKRLMCANMVSARGVASVVGFLASLSRAVHFSGLHLFFLHAFIAELIRIGGWEHSAPLSSEAREELLWWRHQLASPLDRSFIPARPQGLRLVTDASSNQGAFYLFKEKELLNSGTCMFPPDVASMVNAPLKELLAVEFAIRSSLHFVRDCAVLLQSDCSPVVFNLSKENCHALSLLQAMKSLEQMLLDHSISLRPQWIPGLSNQVDTLSRSASLLGDLVLSREFFAQVLAVFPWLNIDAFASPDSAQLPRFLSLSEGGPDFFAFHFRSQDRPFLFPPPLGSLILRVLSRLNEFQGMEGVLCLPNWPTALFFPMVLEMALQILLSPEACEILHSCAQASFPMGTRFLLVHFRVGRHGQPPPFQRFSPHF